MGKIATFFIAIAFEQNAILAFQNAFHTTKRSPLGSFARPSVTTSLSATSKSTHGSSPKNILVGLALASVLAVSSPATPLPSYAYNLDTAGDAVASAVKMLDDATGNSQKSFEAYAEVGKIITEGKGVGGSLTYAGVKLDEKYESDEDTTIYNPGLTLLTESEKQSLVDAIVRNKKGTLDQWTNENQRAFQFLKQSLDPLHMTELRWYLKILPFYGAAIYLAALFVQQNFRELFTFAYIVAALFVFGPVVLLVGAGP